MTLDDDGYIILAGLFDARRLQRLRDAFERVVGREQSGTRHADLRHVDDGAFVEVASDARVAAAVRQVLGRPFHLFTFGARDPLPGFGQQGLHTDWLARGADEPYSVATALWLLDDFTPRNGATRLIPGSHRGTYVLPKAMRQPLARHPNEIIITALAGSVLVFNGHLWHSGTRNETALARRVLQLQYAADDAVRPVDSGVSAAVEQAR